MEYIPNNSHFSQGYLFATSKLPIFDDEHYSNDNPPLSAIESPYYWWYRFLGLYLRDNKKRLLIKGETSPELTELGDPNTIDFKTWWLDRLDLFAEPQGTSRVEIARTTKQLAEFDSNQRVNIVIPIDWPVTAITWHVKQIVAEEQRARNIAVGNVEKPEISLKRSKAKYKLSGKWNTEGFSHAYAVYLAKTEADIESALEGRKIAWADIAIRAGLPLAHGMIEGRKKEQDMEQREKLTVLALRHWKNAKLFTENSKTRLFPRNIN